MRLGDLVVDGHEIADILVHTQHPIETIEELLGPRAPRMRGDRGRAGLGEPVGDRSGGHPGSAPMRAVRGHPVTGVAGTTPKRSQGVRQIDRDIGRQGPGRPGARGGRPGGGSAHRPIVLASFHGRTPAHGKRRNGSVELRRATGPLPLLHAILAGQGLFRNKGAIRVDIRTE